MQFFNDIANVSTQFNLGFLPGVIDKSDFNPEWKSLLKHSPLPRWQPSCQPPLIYQVQDSSLLEREIAFRINAIRETFEETGVMLAVNDSSSSSFILADLELSQWRSRVHDNPSDFITMCKHFDISPDIWSLYEWSDWLTPLHLKTKSRFDTIFFIALFSGQMPNSDHVMAPDGDREVSEVECFSPAEAVNLHVNEKIWLAPPQCYELSRLNTLFKSGNLSDLRTFAQQRALRHGLSTWFPIQALCRDGHAALYPGDDWYPSQPDLTGTLERKVLDKRQWSLQECRQQCQHLNRMEILGPHNGRIVCNIVDPNGHQQVSGALLQSN